MAKQDETPTGPTIVRSKRTARLRAQSAAVLADRKDGFRVVPEPRAAVSANDPTPASPANVAARPAEKAAAEKAAAKKTPAKASTTKSARRR